MIRLLDNMGKFVRDKALALGAAGLIGALTENDVAVQGIGAGTNISR